MMLRLPMRAAMLSAVSPALSCALTISPMKRARSSLAVAWDWLLGMPVRQGAGALAARRGF